VTGFLGRFEHQLDEKGRVSLPAGYRHKAAGTRFVLLQWEPTHLTLFPEDVWAGVRERLLELRRDRRDLSDLLRDVMSRATDVEPDKQGRILIPAWLKERAKLDGGVLLVGTMDRIELWNPEVFRSLHPDDLTADEAKAKELHEIFG
jgi:MraZ protein